MTISPFLSQKLKFYSFISMLFLVFVHGYNLQDTYLQPWSLVQENMTFTSFTEYLFSNGLLRFRIPMLFIISGYLYALTDAKPYGQRTLKRLRTLGLPFLLWSLIALLVSWALEYSPVFAEAIKETHLAQISDKKFFVSQYEWYDWLIRIFLAPVAFQLWFIQTLLFYNIAYPLLSWLAAKKPLVSKIWFGFAILCWLIGISEGLLFFTLGIWIQKRAFDIEKAPRYLSPNLLLTVFLGCAFLKTYLAFQPTTLLKGADDVMIAFFNNFGLLQKAEEVKYFYGFTQVNLINILFKLTEISGMIGIWYGADAVVRWAGKVAFFSKGQDFSFIIYAAHVPILYYLMYLGNIWLKDYTFHRLLTFVVIPLAVILFAMFLGMILRAALPKVYSILTGERGIKTLS